MKEVIEGKFTTIHELKVAGNKKEVEKKQSYKKSNKEIKVNLDFNIDDFYKSFDKPGDCIKRLFEGIEEDPIFKNVEDTNTNLNLSSIPIEVFKNNVNDNKIVSACYIYNYKFENKPLQRLEIAIATKNEGWVWMMGSLPTMSNSESQTTSYREFILKNETTGWKTTLGHEGRTQFHNFMEPQKLKTASGFESNMNHKWVNLKNNTECSQDCSNPNPYKAFSSYWKPDDFSSKILGKLWNNTEEQILRWGKHKNKIHGSHVYDGEMKNDRYRIYKDGKWYKKIDSYVNREILKIDVEDLKKKKGTWENLYNLCNSKETDEYYKMYCM